MDGGEEILALVGKDERDVGSESVCAFHFNPSFTSLRVLSDLSYKTQSFYTPFAPIVPYLIIKLEDPQ